MSIAANKFPGIRASVTICSPPGQPASTMTATCSAWERELSVPVAEEIVNIWLHTEFAGGRHQRRLDKITAIEQRFEAVMSRMSKLTEQMQAARRVRAKLGLRPGQILVLGCSTSEVMGKGLVPTPVWRSPKRCFSLQQFVDSHQLCLQCSVVSI